MSHPIPAPTLVLIDIQREYIAAGRPFNLAGIGPSLDRCRALLAHARASGWQIVHVQHLNASGPFARGSDEAAFIAGFEPLAGERHIVKSKLSCFTSDDFTRMVAEAGDGEILIAGYGSTMCCLATAVDATLFGRKLTFVHDASWARVPGPGFTEAETHRHATAILGIHAKLMTTDEAFRLAQPLQAA